MERLQLLQALLRQGVPVLATDMHMLWVQDASSHIQELARSQAAGFDVATGPGVLPAHEVLGVHGTAAGDAQVVHQMQQLLQASTGGETGG